MGNLSKAQGTTCVGLDNLEGLSFFYRHPFCQTNKGAGMSERVIQSRLNIKSYLANSLFFLPILSLGILLGNSQSDSEFTQAVMAFARLFSLVFTVIYFRFTYRRLHDANRSGWFSFALIPPFTIFLLFYLFTASKDGSNKWGEPMSGLTIFGIRAKGWRVLAIFAIAIFMTYLTAMFAMSLFDYGTYR